MGNNDSESNSGVRAFLDKTINWIECNLEHFKLSENNANEIHSTIKPFGELVLTCNLLNKYGITDSRVEQIVNWAWEQLNKGEKLIDLLVARNDLIILSSIYSDFQEMGFKCERLSYLISYLSKINPTSNIENPFWRQLNVIYILSKLHITKFPKNALKKSWLGGNLPPWMINDDLAYAITHEIFYVTDFGLLPERLNKEIKEYIQTWIYMWIEIYRTANNYDIIIEFAIVYFCLNTEIPSELIKEIKEIQNKDGSFPGPKNGGSRLSKGDHSLGRLNFNLNYHTTLVGCIFLVIANKKAVTLIV